MATFYIKQMNYNLDFLLILLRYVLQALKFYIARHLTLVWVKQHAQFLKFSKTYLGLTMIFKITFYMSFLHQTKFFILLLL